jgi:hypothetical protein
VRIERSGGGQIKVGAALERFKIDFGIAVMGLVPGSKLFSSSSCGSCSREVAQTENPVGHPFSRQVSSQ